MRVFGFNLVEMALEFLEQDLRTDKLVLLASLLDLGQQFNRNLPGLGGLYKLADFKVGLVALHSLRSFRQLLIKGQNVLG